MNPTVKITTTYTIQARDNGQWHDAPGEAQGWTLAEARRAVRAGVDGMDGGFYGRADLRIVDADGHVVE